MQAQALEEPDEVDARRTGIPIRRQSVPESWKSVYFEPLITALKGVAVDDMSRGRCGPLYTK